MPAQELTRKLAVPGVVLWDGPDPLPEGEEWCLICMLRAKKLACEVHDKIIKEHEENGDGKILRLPIVVEGTILEKAVVTALSPLVPQFGFVKLCWSHVAGLELLTPEQMALRQGTNGLAGR